MDQTQSTHYTLQATFDFRDVEKAIAAGAGINAGYAGRLRFMVRRGSKVTVQGSEDNLKSWLADLKRAGSVSGLLYAGLHANLTHAAPAADPVL
jgi:hypothetical protein